MGLIREAKRKLKANPVTDFGIYMVKYRMIVPLIRARTDAAIERNRRLGLHNGLLALKGGHAGESCFIVGNGPSVRMDDLDRIRASGADSFGANRITDLFPKTSWRPTYLCVMDPGFLTGLGRTTSMGEYLDTLRGEGVGNVFFNSTMLEDVPEGRREGVVFVDVPGASMFRTNLAPFSDDASVYVSDLGSVTHFSIQVAAYLGYGDIYLYGVDDSYTKYLGPDGAFHIDNSVESHVEGMRANQDDEHADHVPLTQFEAYRMRGFADLRKTALGYAMCREWAESHGVSIRNATRGGKLEAFERVDFDSAIAEARSRRAGERGEGGRPMERRGGNGAAREESEARRLMGGMRI